MDGTRKVVIVTLFYLKPSKKNVIYKKPYVWRTTFKNAKQFKENDVIPFVGTDKHKHYGFVYKKSVDDFEHAKHLKYLIPYDSHSKVTGRRLKKKYYDNWELFKKNTLHQC